MTWSNSRVDLFDYSSPLNYMILFKYIARDLFATTAAVTIALLLIVASGRFAKYLSKASSGDLSAELLLPIILYRIPDFLPLVLPLSLFVGAMLVFGRLFVDSEMTAMRAGGVNKFQILVIGLIPAFMLSTFVAMLTLWLAPASLAQVQHLLEQSKNSQSPAFLREGHFQSLSSNNVQVFYVGDLTNDGDMSDVFFFSGDDEGNLSILKAESATIVDAAEQKVFTVLNGNIASGKLGALDFQLGEFSKYVYPFVLGEFDETVELKIDAMPTLALIDQETREELAALHWRFSLPTTVLVVIVIAIALSETSPRAGRYSKMLPAIIFYLIYILTLAKAREEVVDGMQPVFMWLTHAAFLVVALIIYFAKDISLVTKRLIAEQEK